MTDTVSQICKLLEPFNTNGSALSAATDISTDLNIDSVTVMDFVSKNRTRQR